MLRPAQKLSHSGPAALAFTNSHADPVALFNLKGAAALETPPALDSGTPSLLDPPPADMSSRTACAVGGAFSYCMDGEGAVTRRRLGENDGRVVAHAIPGSPIAAAGVGAHAVLLYLAPQRTTEGLVSHAFAVLDEGEPATITEPGSGATNVALAVRGGELLAMYIDARVALTPVHARVLRVGAELGIGRDAVVLLAGGADGSQTGAVGATPIGIGYVLVPTTTEDGGFGLAVVRIEGEPTDDMPVVWSRYPSGRQAGPVAATDDREPVLVASARPESSAAGARAVLELGRLGAAGEHESLCLLADAPQFHHVALARGADGALWIAYTTADGTFVEQRGRGPAAPASSTSSATSAPSASGSAAARNPAPAKKP